MKIEFLEKEMNFLSSVSPTLCVCVSLYVAKQERIYYVSHYQSFHDIFTVSF